MRRGVRTWAVQSLVLVGAGHEVLRHVLVHATGHRVARMRVQAALGCQVQRIQARVRLKNAACTSG
jgi:hypothetical protein